MKSNNPLHDIVPKVASIGFFDGVHQGHCFLIGQVQKLASERGMEAMLVTFDKHPREVLHADYVPQLLTTTQEKLQLLREAGMDRVEVLHFDTEMSKLKARDFMEQVLRDRLGVRILVMGYDHRFGNGGGQPEDYVRWGKEVGIEVLRADEMPELHVSSSECRRWLKEGNVEYVAQLLGHPYLLTGYVAEGHHIGHQLGFPTANLVAERGKVVPKDGVYAVWVRTERGRRLKGMLNIGKRPTLDNGDDTSIEVNILDFNGNIYGETLQLEFVKRIRDEQRFDSLEELQRQLEEDRRKVIDIC